MSLLDIEGDKPKHPHFMRYLFSDSGTASSPAAAAVDVPAFIHLRHVKARPALMPRETSRKNEKFQAVRGQMIASPA